MRSLVPGVGAARRLILTLFGAGFSGSSIESSSHFERFFAVVALGATCFFFSTGKRVD